MVVLEVSHVKVRSLSVDFLEISWEVEPTSEDILDYTFQVLRSEGPSGPWEPVSPELEDRFFFVDNHVKVGNRFRTFYYLIRVRHKPSSEVLDFGPSSQSAEPDLVALEIQKHIHLLMREFVGRRCWVLPARTFGQRCTACYNQTLKARTKSGCHGCFDTSFVRGYLSPIETWIQFDPSSDSAQPTNVGELQSQNTTARMGYFPPLKPKDVIVEPENRRWRVTAVTQTERLRATVHQEIQLHQIPRSDMEYAISFDLGTGEVVTPDGKVQVPYSLHNMSLASGRNFTNPQNLDNFLDEEIPEIFGLYRTTYPRVKT